MNNNHILAALLAVAIGLTSVLASIQPALANVPPAGKPFIFVSPTPTPTSSPETPRPPVEECNVQLVYSTPRLHYSQNTNFPLMLGISRIKGKGRIRVVIELPDQTRIAGGASIDPNSIFDIEADPANQNPLTSLKTVNPVNVNTTVNASVNFFIKPDASPGPLDIRMKAYSLNEDGSVKADCVDDGAGQNPIIIIDLADQFDMKMTASANPLVYRPGEQNVAIKGLFSNDSGARNAIPRSMPFKVTLTYPTAVAVNSSPDAIEPFSGSTTATEVTWDLTTTKDIYPGQSYSPQFVVKVDLPDNFTSSITFKYCVMPSRSAGQQMEKPGGLQITRDGTFPIGNNCDTVTIYESPVEVHKTWDDGTVANKSFAPGEDVSFKLTVKNISSDTLTGLTLRDVLQRSISCNSVTDPNCAGWDETIKWGNNPGWTVNGANKELTYDSPLTIPPNSSLPQFTLKGEVIDGPSLVNKLSPNNAQAHCNVATIRYVSPNFTSDEQSRLCWTYDIDSEVKVTKFIKLSNGALVAAANLQQGTIGTYVITAENTGQYDALGTTFLDEAIEGATYNQSGHLFQWMIDPDGKLLPSGPIAGDPNMIANNEKLSINGWSSTVLKKGEKKVFEPQFAIPCDAYERLSPADRAQAFIKNVATVTAQNQSSAATSDPTFVNVKNAHYNLGTIVTSVPTQVVAGDPVSGKTKINVAVSNTSTFSQPVDISVPLVDVVGNLPAQFSVVPGTIQPGGSVENGKVVWDTIPSIAPGQVINLSVIIEASEQAISTTPSPAFRADAVSITAGNSCGRASGAANIGVVGASFDAVKTLLDPINRVGERSQAATFELRVINTSSLASLKRGEGEELIVTDNLTPNFDYDSSATACKLVNTTTGAETPCTPTDATGPNNSNNVLTWQVARLDKRSTTGFNAVAFSFKAKISETVAIAECPSILYNSSANNPSTITDPLNPGYNKQFNPEFLNVYPNICLQGSIYAGSNNEVDSSVKIISEDLVIDPNTILSAKGSIQCNLNESCIDAPYKYGNYDVKDSTGLKLDDLIKRMATNIKRILSRATAFGQDGTTTIAGSAAIFNLYCGNTDACDTAKKLIEYPEGRVWVHKGDLVLDTSTGPIKFVGKGTFVIEGGNLVVTGGDKVIYNDDSNKNAVGFIVLPSVDKTKGQVTIGSAVTAFHGAIYAPGTPDANPATGPAGLITLEAGDTQLRPIEGLFIAREFSILRKKAVFRYKASLNTPEGAPPGFTFFSSPDDTNEGF